MSRQKQAFAEHLLDNATWPERILWSRLRHKTLGYSFQRQAIVCGFIADFWCPTAKVVIEVDGGIHEYPTKIADDQRKDEAYYRAGITCLRFKNEDVRKGMSAVLIRIWETCYDRAPIPLRPVVRANPSRRYEGEVEIVALHRAQEARRLENHARDFAEKYRKKRAKSVDDTARGRFLAWAERKRAT